MSQVVSSHPYCLENSVHLTRTGSDSFYHIDGNNAPTVIDKHQVKRLYRLQRTPYVNTQLHLDKSDVEYEKQGYFESILQKQIQESSSQPIRSIYHKPTDMSDTSMARFSFGKGRPDPQRLIPSEMTSIRKHPSAITILRHEQGSNNEIVPRFTDRSILDRTLRGRLGPGGSLNPDEDSKQARDYLRTRGRLPSQPKLTNSPRIQQRSITDELARHYMYTSTQQAAFDEVAWDSKLPSKIPVPLTSYEANGSDPLLISRSLPSFQDVRTPEVLNWDRVQSRDTNFYRKPFNNVAPLPRAQQISGYSGVIGGYNIQDIDNPTIDFKPYTVVRSEQPKPSINSFKPNIPFYTGKTHWAKIDPVSHHDQSGHAYTTTAAFHKPLPFDSSSPRYTGLHGSLSQIVTTVHPQNPYNQIDNTSTTINSSIDSRPHVILRQLPAKNLPSPREKEQITTESTE